MLKYMLKEYQDTVKMVNSYNEEDRISNLELKTRYRLISSNNRTKLEALKHFIV